ncbi:MAG: ABC transporter ATP-binding protein [Euryarchaeota archaeon]|nr:ABC transporter ATP-binding protein [Euryarchaeota archaeon]
MPEKIVEVENLVKRYKDVTAVDGISFDIHEGEIFSLVGPNGAGKTTTVEMLECLRTPTSGNAEVLGHNIYDEEMEIKKRIGVMPQDFSGFERLTVKENVELIAKIYNVEPETKEVLEELGVWGERDRQFQELSGGMQRRVGICMALISDPELLFLDEPTTGLDPYARRETWDVIQTLKELGKTVLLTSHYMDEVEQLSDRVGLLLEGKLVATDTVHDLISQYGGGIIVRVKGGGTEEAKKLLLTFTDEISDERSTVTGRFKTREEASKALTELYQLGDGHKIEILESGMDEVFAQIAGGKVNERGEFV